MAYSQMSAQHKRELQEAQDERRENEVATWDRNARAVQTMVETGAPQAALMDPGPYGDVVRYACHLEYLLQESQEKHQKAEAERAGERVEMENVERQRKVNAHFEKARISTLHEQHQELLYRLKKHPRDFHPAAPVAKKPRPASVLVQSHTSQLQQVKKEWAQVTAQVDEAMVNLKSHYELLKSCTRHDTDARMKNTPSLPKTEFDTTTTSVETWTDDVKRLQGVFTTLQERNSSLQSLRRTCGPCMRVDLPGDDQHNCDDF
jgi:hypothetical protein